MTGGSYALFGNASESALRRLRSIEAAWDAGTFRELERLRIGRGWHCLEVGAGAGSVAEWLAERVGSTGEVLATDTDPGFLRHLARPNLRVECHDVVADALPPGRFDLIHARMVLQHLPEADAVVEKLVSALKPGGWLIVEDSDWTTLFRAEPCDRRLLAVKDGLARVMRGAGFDTARGLRNAGALRAAGLQDVGAAGRVNVMQPGSAGVEWYREWLTQLRGALAATGVDDALVDHALAHFEAGQAAWLSQTMIAARGRAPSDDGRRYGPRSPSAGLDEQ